MSTRVLLDTVADRVVRFHHDPAQDTFSRCDVVDFVCVPKASWYAIVVFTQASIWVRGLSRSPQSQGSEKLTRKCRRVGTRRVGFIFQTAC